MDAATGLFTRELFAAHLGRPLDDALRRAQWRLWDELRLISEPGGAAAVAALLEGAYVPAEGERVVAIVCGGNVDPASVAALGETTQGR